MSLHRPRGQRVWTRQPLRPVRASPEFRWDVLINQAFPQVNAANGRPITPRGSLLSGGGLVGRNWYGINALEQIAAPMPTTTTGYTAIWVGPMNVVNTGTNASMVRTTGDGFRLESYTTFGGAYISLTHTGVAVGPTIAPASWSTFTNDPFVVIVTYDGTTVRVGWRPPPSAALTGAVEGTAAIGMNAGSGTLDLSTSAGSFGAYLVGYAARAMPAGLFRELLLNPWAVFEPPEREVFYSLGGGSTYSYTASGGLSFSGTSPQTRESVRGAAGGVVFGGAAGYSTTGLQTLAVTASGGLQTGGASPVSRTRAVAAFGGAQFSGIAGYETRETERVVTPSGGIVFSGSAERAFPFDAIGARRGIWGRYGILDVRRGKVGL